MYVRLCVLGTLILAGCASPYVKVSLVHPHLTGAPGVGLLASEIAEVTLIHACCELQKARIPAR